ncbi:MAG: ISL3 family transposase, partial [Mycobacteriales bacterium]
EASSTSSAPNARRRSRLSMDMGPAYDKSVRKPGHATNAIICYDPFHVMQLATTALDKVRRGVWQELRKLPDQDAARRFQGARWALLKNPGDLTEDEVGMLLDRFCSKASRSGLKPFVTLAQTIRKRRSGILAAIRLKINNARHEGLNRPVRLIINRAYGFHSANAALALIMVTLGRIEHVLPHERMDLASP